MKSILFVVLFSYTFSVLGQASPEVDRQQFFNSIYERMIPLLYQSVTFDQANLNQEQKTILSYLAQINQAYTAQSVDAQGKLQVPRPLIFSRDQSIFTLSPNQPPRTAVVGKNYGDPIYVNLNVIKNPKFNPRISDVFQLLLHELLHFVPGFPQGSKDAVAAMLAKNTERSEIKVSSTDGFNIQAMTNDTVLFGTHPSKAKVAEVDHFLFFNPFFFFVQNNAKVKDLSREIAVVLEKRRRLEVMADGRSEYMRRHFWKLESITPVTENDSKRSWFKVAGSQVDLVIPSNKTEINVEDIKDLNDAPEKTASLHEFVIGIRNDDFSIDRIYNVERFAHMSVDEKAKITVLQEDEKEIKILLEFEESKYHSPKDSEVFLIANSARRAYQVGGKRVSADKFEFVFKKPSKNVEINIESFSVRGKQQVFVKEALPINSYSKEAANKKMRFAKIGIRVGETLQALRTTNYLPTEKASLELLIESETPIREVQIYDSKSYRILNNQANQDFLQASINPNLKVPVKRTDYQLSTFTANQFTQVKVAANQYRVQIPYDLFLSPLMKSSKDFTDQIQRNPLAALMNIQKLMEDMMKTLPIGTDTGKRAIHRISVTNESLQELDLYREDKPIILNLGYGLLNSQKFYCPAVFM